MSEKQSKDIDWLTARLRRYEIGIPRDQAKDGTFYLTISVLSSDPIIVSWNDNVAAWDVNHTRNILQDEFFEGTFYPLPPGLTADHELAYFKIRERQIYEGR